MSLDRGIVLAILSILFDLFADKEIFGWTIAKQGYGNNWVALFYEYNIIFAETYGFNEYPNASTLFWKGAN